MISSFRKLLRGKPEAPLPAIPDGERVFAIGDIHGRLDLFTALIAAVEAQDERRGPAHPTIILLGDLIDRGELDAAKHPRIFIHTIDAEKELASYKVSSKYNSEIAWLRHLFDLGRSKADAFLAAHFDDIGARSSTDIAAKFL